MLAPQKTDKNGMTLGDEAWLSLSDLVQHLNRVALHRFGSMLDQLDELPDAGFVVLGDDFYGEIDIWPSSLCPLDEASRDSMFMLDRLVGALAPPPEERGVLN
jgi:hypothetical protein